MAGIAAKMTLIEAIRQRPASCDFSSSSISFSESPVNRSTSAGPAPSVLLSWMPLIESDSSTVALMSASWRCCCAVICRRIRATRLVRMIAGGITTSEISERRQESATIAIEVATAVVRLAAIEAAVEVTTASMPPMSLVIRDWISPVRVRLKKSTRLPLQVREDVAAQPVHDLLPHGRRHPGLDHAEAGGHGCRATMPITSQRAT